MQITLNQAEVEQLVQAHIDTLVVVTGDAHVTFNDDGTVLVTINEEAVSDDSPPVVERKRRQRRNAAEAKHVPVEAKEALTGNEIQTSTGGVSENSTQEAEQATKVEAKTEPTQELEEEEAEAETVTEETVVEEVVQEKVEAEKPATTKPSLFAGLKR